MFDVFQEFATDSKKEVEGVWRDLGKGARLLVARANNRKYGKLLNKLFEQHREALDREDDAADALSDQIMVDVFAETILLGWEKLSYKGAELPYSKDNAKMLLQHAEFRLKVSRMAGEVDQYKAALEVEQGKA